MAELAKSVLSTTNGLQMFQTKKPFWILTTEIEVIFLRVSLLSEYDLVSNSLVWKGLILEKRLRKTPDAVSQSFQRERDHFLNRAKTINERK